MTREEFKEAIQRLKDFEQERDKLDAVVNAISPTSTAVVEIGGYFIDSYIKVLEIALKCPNGWVSAFVFECEYGLYPFTGELDGKDFSVQTEDEFYDLVQEYIHLSPFKNLTTYSGEPIGFIADSKVMLNSPCSGMNLEYYTNLSGNTGGIQIGTDTDKYTIK